MRGITVKKSPEGIKDDKNTAGEDKQTKKKTEPVACKFRFEANSIKNGVWVFLIKLNRLWDRCQILVTINKGIETNLLSL